MTHGTSFAGLTTTGDVDQMSKVSTSWSAPSGWRNDHAAGFAGTENWIHRLAVHDDVAGTFLAKTRATADLRRPVP